MTGAPKRPPVKLPPSISYLRYLRRHRCTRQRLDVQTHFYGSEDPFDDRIWDGLIILLRRTKFFI